jgi:hypothetical protein
MLMLMLLIMIIISCNGDQTIRSRIMIKSRAASELRMLYPKRPVEGAVLNRFADVLRRDGI